MAKVAQLRQAEFARHVEAGDGLTLVEFYADWCGPCKAIGPILVELAEEYEDRISVAKLDADAHPEVLVKYGVRSLPTLMMFDSGKPVGQRVGALPASRLREFVNQHAPDFAVR